MHNRFWGFPISIAIATKEVSDAVEELLDRTNTHLSSMGFLCYRHFNPAEAYEKYVAWSRATAKTMARL